MYYQPEAMLEQYDIEIKQITKGRGVFCCETDQGKKYLHRFGDLQNAQICARNIMQHAGKGISGGTGQSDKRRAVCGNG